MKIKNKWIALLLILTMVLTACTNDPVKESGENSGETGQTVGEQNGKDDGTDGNTGETGGAQSGGDNGIGDMVGETGEAVKVDFAQSDDEMFTSRDGEAEYNEKKSVVIQLNGNSAECSSDAVQINGTTVMIIDEGTYILRGTLDDGMIIVNVEEKDKPQLVLDGVSIHSATSAPIYILEGDKVFITLAEGTENRLSNGGTFTAIDENNIDAVVFSKQDLTFNGSGSLTVDSPAGHGIVSKDDLVFTGGTYTITAASHGLSANDSVRIRDAVITIDAGKDGIQAENTDDATLGFVYISSGSLNIAAEGDGISGEAYLQIEGGTFDITSGGGSENGDNQGGGSFGGGWGGGFGGGMGGMGRPGQSSSTDTDEDGVSMKAIKATGNMLISNGTFTIDSADDAIHSNATIYVNGGVFEIATGDDGFHADEGLTITAGTISISESYEGLEALDIAVSGGTISLYATDDGLNAAGGTDSSGTGGMFGNDQFGGGRPGGMGGMGSSNGSIVLSGGYLYINAAGDGIDANGYVEITGGTVIVSGPNMGDTATLDYDTSATITGGTFIGTGASQMAQTFSAAEQGVIAVRVGSQSAGAAISVTDADGKVILSHEADQAFSVVILSSPEIISGKNYTLVVGTASGEVTAQ